MVMVMMMMWTFQCAAENYVDADVADVADRLHVTMQEAFHRSLTRLATFTPCQLLHSFSLVENFMITYVHSTCV